MEMRHFGRMKQATGAKEESASLILIVAVERDTRMYGIKEVNKEAKKGCVSPWAAVALPPYQI
jgi:hypothetical protein